MNLITLENDYLILRDLLEQHRSDTQERWRIINQHSLIDTDGQLNIELYVKLCETEFTTTPIERYLNFESFKNDFEMKLQAKSDKRKQKGEDFEFYEKIEQTDIPEKRRNTAPGIKLINLRYHSTQPVEASDAMPETGFNVTKDIEWLIRTQHPKYQSVLQKYCRPLGTTDATFNDFNKEQKESQPFTQERKDSILELVRYYLDIKPYRPIHYEGTSFARLPLSTGTGYFDRTSERVSILASMTRSEVYKEKPSCKGYYYNATVSDHQVTIHNFKHFRLPVRVDKDTVHPPALIWSTFIAQHATMLFTRNHISTMDKLKQRPVYNVDPIFLKVEAMLTLPALVQARLISCCIMYSLETIRGGCHYLDNEAKKYTSYFTIDWSSFDQTLPQVITDLYYTDFLESVIVINKGYQPTVTFPNVEGQPPDVLFNKMSNLLNCLHTWYNSMVFVSADGYGYQRTCAGVPSGLFNTQYLDSFGNLCLIMDGLLEYGFTTDEIKKIRFFIMGDDNSGFTNLPIMKLEQFIDWFATYANTRWNMTLSAAKSIVTGLRNKIEILSYKNNFGMPTRPIAKLVAQLCYPERQMKPQFMSYRAIGMAYAAAGSDLPFHNFCRDIYLLYARSMAPLTEENKLRLGKHLPGIFRALDKFDKDIDFTKFPDIHDVRKKYSYWQGSLQYEPKWDRSYFTTDPLCLDEDAITMLQYRNDNKIPRNEVIKYDINKYL